MDFSPAAVQPKRRLLQTYATISIVLKQTQQKLDGPEAPRFKKKLFLMCLGNL